MPDPLGLEVVADKLAKRAPLLDAEYRAILALPHSTDHVPPSANFIQEGARPTRCAFILSGFAFRHKLTRTGARQITAIMMPGDFVDLPHLYLSTADHSVQALTPVVAASIEVKALRNLAAAYPMIAQALWVEASVDAAIDREWIVNLGRRESKIRIAHLLCEFALRLERAGLPTEGGFELPMTQEQIADATGLTPVHVNRVLQSLLAQGLIRREGRFYGSDDWPQLQRFADFAPLYLHFDETDPPIRTANQSQWASAVH